MKEDICKTCGGIHCDDCGINQPLALQSELIAALGVDDMGMFDRVYIACPKCGNKIEFQSKAGVCELNEYGASDVPASIAGDIIGDEQQCQCGAVVRIDGGFMIWPVITSP